MVALISNYIDIQKLYEDIEDKIIKEKQQKAHEADKCPYLSGKA